mmetsp:Transcript_45784/g.106338  ORF Transcript_45784/g.106338 Transcript_45784/m.106338 type:complete len:139 (-) Transcript_45784:44-460(-)
MPSAGHSAGKLDMVTICGWKLMGFAGAAGLAGAGGISKLLNPGNMLPSDGGKDPGASPGSDPKPGLVPGNGGIDNNGFDPGSNGGSAAAGGGGANPKPGATEGRGGICNEDGNPVGNGCPAILLRQHSKRPMSSSNLN